MPSALTPPPPPPPPHSGAAAAVADFPAFVAAGIDTFDMGPETCGYGAAESVVGEFLKTGGAPSALVFTKLCCVGQEQAKPSGEWVRSRVDRALSRLGGHKRLDVMQLYWNEYSYTPQLKDMSLYLMDERAAGRVGAVGFTNMDTAHLAALADAGVEVASHQIQFSLLDRRPAREQLAWCAASGCKLLPYGVLAGGLLSDAYLNVRAEDVVLNTSSKGKYASVINRAGGWPWFQRLLATLRAVGDAHGGASVSNVAARWVLDHDAVSAVILGARNASHVADHTALFAFSLTAADREAIEAVLAEGKQAQADTYSWERGGGVF
jgi:aryl-alcohol dehydrogenase-like predicted oxidoreductase